MVSYRRARPGLAAAISGQEVKFADRNFADAALNIIYTTVPMFTELGAAYTGFANMMGVDVGASVSQRIGDKIKVISIKIEFDLVGSATTINSPVRCLLVYDRAPNAVAPAYTDIIEASGLMPAFAAPISNINRERFSIIRDIYTTISNSSALARHITISKRGSWLQQYRTNGITIGNLTRGAFYLLMFRGTGMGAGDVYVRNLMARFRFVE